MATAVAPGTVPGPAMVRFLDDVFKLALMQAVMEQRGFIGESRQRNDSLCKRGLYHKKRSNLLWRATKEQ
jgi:hypothetical protein